MTRKMSSKRKTSSLCSCFGTDVSWTQHDPTWPNMTQQDKPVSKIKELTFERAFSNERTHGCVGLILMPMHPQVLGQIGQFWSHTLDRTRDRMWTAWSPISPRRRRVWCRCRRPLTIRSLVLAGANATCSTCTTSWGLDSTEIPRVTRWSRCNKMQISVAYTALLGHATTPQVPKHVGLNSVVGPEQARIEMSVDTCWHTRWLTHSLVILCYFDMTMLCKVPPGRPERPPSRKDRACGTWGFDDHIYHHLNTFLWDIYIIIYIYI